ncbi:MAG: DUF3108 domain-containing protein [Deltaproteobacteria bacterium]|nr:DUF3108 domain-containing protein [Deltaproteobacteria bacterium]
MKRQNTNVFLAALFLTAAIFALPCARAAVHAEEKQGVEASEGAQSLRADTSSGTIGARYANEELVYQVGVLFFDDAATGTVSLKKGGDNDYVATFTAHTVGVVDRIYHRQDTYVAHLKEVDHGRRFVTKSFEKTIEVNGKVRKGVTSMDYAKNEMTWKSWGGGKDDRTGLVRLKDGMRYDDPLAAFYNFRYGVYGAIKELQIYKIPTFPKEDHTPEIFLRVASKGEFDKKTNGLKPYADYLAEVKLDRELFGSGSGEIDIFFTEGLVPVEAVAKDVVFFGDVRGKLREIGITMDMKKTAGMAGE